MDASRARGFAEYLVQYFGFTLPQATELADNHEPAEIVAAIHAVKLLVTSSTPPRNVAEAFRKALGKASGAGVKGTPSAGKRKPTQDAASAGKPATKLGGERP